MNTATRTTINVRLHDHAIDMMWWVMRFVNVECHFDRVSVCVYVCYFRESAGDVTCVVGSHCMSHATACIYCTAESCYKYTVAPNYSAVLVPPRSSASCGRTVMCLISSATLGYTRLHSANAVHLSFELTTNQV